MGIVVNRIIPVIGTAVESRTVPTQDWNDCRQWGIDNRHSVVAVYAAALGDREYEAECRRKGEKCDAGFHLVE